MPNHEVTRVEVHTGQGLLSQVSFIHSIFIRCISLYCLRSWVILVGYRPLLSGHAPKPMGFAHDWDRRKEDSKAAWKSPRLAPHPGLPCLLQNPQKQGRKEVTHSNNSGQKLEPFYPLLRKLRGAVERICPQPGWEAAETVCSTAGLPSFLQHRQKLCWAALSPFIWIPGSMLSIQKLNYQLKARPTATHTHPLGISDLAKRSINPQWILTSSDQ